MHRIRRQVLDLELPREAGAVELQRQVGRVFQEKVLPRLDELFSRIAPEDHFVRIDRLEIDLGTLGETNWEQHFVERCVEQVARHVAEVSFEAGPSDKAQTLRPEERTREIFRYFLETGVLPWFARGTTLVEVETLLATWVAERPASVQQVLLSVLKKNESALRRLVWQFTPKFSETLLEIALGLAPGWIGQAVQIRQGQTGQVLDAAGKTALIRVLLHGASSGALPPLPRAGVLATLYAEAQAGQPAPKRWFAQPDTGPTEAGPVPNTDAEAHSDDPGRPLAPIPDASEKAPLPRKTAIPPEGILVDHAGLVLLGVYLPAFLGELKCTTGNAFADPDAQYRALHLLHYLATGTENPEEPALAFPKILCGMAIEDPVPLELPLTEAEKGECRNLLEAVVRNWDVLKNTSADGLRAGFLQRTGQVLWQPDRHTWLLRVERQGQDILLDRLPWTYSVVKLPWMEALVQVEW